MERDVTKTVTQISKPRKKKKEKFRMAAWRGRLTTNVESRRMDFGGQQGGFQSDGDGGFSGKSEAGARCERMGRNPLKGRPIQAGRKGGSSSGTGLRWRISSVLLGGLRWIPRPLSSPGNRPRKLRWGNLKVFLLLTTKRTSEAQDICYPGPFTVKPARMDCNIAGILE